MSASTLPDLTSPDMPQPMPPAHLNKPAIAIVRREEEITSIEKLPEYLTYEEAAKLLRVTKPTLRRMWKTGAFPKPIKANQRLYRWPKSVVIEWKKKQEASS